jgi:hypothetical protein
MLYCNDRVQYKPKEEQVDLEVRSTEYVPSYQAK